MDDHLIARLHELDDLAALNSLIGRYRTLADSFRYREWSELFTVDAHFDMPGTPFADMRGRAKIYETCIAQNEGVWAATQHLMINTEFTVQSDDAMGLGDKITVFVPKSDGQTPDAILSGTRYRYRFRRTADGWRISEIIGEALWTGSVKSTASAFAVEAPS